MKKNVGPDLFDDEIALRVKNDAVNQLNNKVGEIKVVCETLLEALDSTNAKTVFKDSVTFYQNYIRKGKQIELKSSLFETFELFDLIFSNPKKARDIFSNASFRELYTLVSDSLFLSIVNMFKHELNIKKLPVESYIPNEQSKTDIENIETNEKNANFIKNELHTSNLSHIINILIEESWILII